MGHLLFSFNGRINRAKYWLASFAIQVLVILFVAIITAFEHQETPSAYLPVMITLIYVSLAVSVKRCHDRNRSGWFILVNLIPIVGQIWAFVELYLFPGTEGENSYGADPLEKETINA